MSRAHILVVEDDKNVAAGLRDIFSVQGYTVWIAENNRDSLSILQTETVDLTMLDVSLGADSGYDLCRDIRRFSDMGAALEKSQSCMNRLTDEIDKILKSSQLAEGKIRMAFEAVDLRKELSVCRERLTAIADTRKVAVKIDGPGTLILPADPFWLSQALENVMKNAVEHTAPGSTATVSYFDERRDIHIQIMDEGSGIPPEELATLFDRFHRGETSKAGYGIGLSMAKDIITAHHGTISARNRGGRGTLFEIVLPVLEGVTTYAC